MVHVETRGAFVFATLDAPATRNALTDAMVGGLIDALRLADSLSETRALVLRGAGGTFCAGGDFSGFRASMATPAPTNGADPIATGNRRFGALAMFKREPGGVYEATGRPTHTRRLRVRRARQGSTRESRLRRSRTTQSPD